MTQRVAKGRRRQPGLSAGKTLAVALVLFSMLCGLALMVAPYRAGGLPATQLIRVNRAVERIDKATNALEATNYGETRDHLRAARETLRKMTEQD